MSVKLVLIVSLISYLVSRSPTYAANFPQIYNLWGGYNAAADSSYFAGFNLYMFYADGSKAIDQNRADAIHALNLNTKILITADIIPAHAVGSLDSQPQWWSAVPGTPDYACIVRNSSGTILKDITYNAAYNNLASGYCRDVLVNHFINRWNLTNGHFDGWQVDQAGDSGITWTLGNDIDLNVDGVPDDSAQVDAQYTAGMINVFTRLRTALPGIIIHANDSPVSYGQWLNGRLFEMDMKRYLDKTDIRPWPDLIRDWTEWSALTTNMPNTTGIMNSPPTNLITSKYTFQNIWSNIKPAMMTEYGADYDRMRFGLVSALMAGVQYTYDLSGYMYGVNWWYEEYGTRSTPASTGYLGQPTGSATLISRITTPDQVVNNTWFTATSSAAVVATLSKEGSISHINLPGASTGWALFRTNYVSVETGKYYTLSFKAKANANRLGGVRVQRAGGAWEYLASGPQIRFYPVWTQYDLVLKATGTGTNGTLMFDLGIAAGDIYFDDIKFQEGVGGIWQRHFERGTALLNESPLAQTITLDKTYQKLAGTQAPLYSQRIDDDQALVAGNWATVDASFDQWGTKIHQITGPDSNASLTYTFNPAYPGEYELLSWVVPAANQSPNVTVSVNGTNTLLNQTTGILGWHSLGKFNLNGQTNVVIKPLGTGVVIGDAMKIVSTARYNGGSIVNQITLQPNDAIILLNQANPPPTVDYLDYLNFLKNFPCPSGALICEGESNIFEFNTLVKSLSGWPL